MNTHHLISLRTLNGVDFHSYLITADEKKDVQRACGHIIDEADKRKLRHMSTVLHTMLKDEDDIKAVEDHLCKYGPPNMKKLLATVDNFHYTLFWETGDISEELLNMH